MIINKDNLLKLLEIPLNDSGYKLVDIEFVNRTSEKIIQLYIFNPKGINIKDCVKANDIAWGIMSKEKKISEDYTIEISSPGIFMKLKRPEHFKIFKGKRIRVKLVQKIKGYKMAIGNIVNCTENGINLKMDVLGECIRIPYSLICKANLEPEISI